MRKRRKLPKCFERYSYHASELTPTDPYAAAATMDALRGIERSSNSLRTGPGFIGGSAQECVLAIDGYLTELHWKRPGDWVEGNSLMPDSRPASVATSQLRPRLALAIWPAARIITSGNELCTGLAALRKGPEWPAGQFVSLPS
jgi:hypothetical protein